MKKWFFLLIIFFSAASFSANKEKILQCSGYKVEIIVGSMVKINGELVTSQENTLLGSSGLRIEMTLMPASDGNNYGFEFVKRNGKAFLNVQLLQADMDAPPIIGSYPCKKVSD